VATLLVIYRTPKDPAEFDRYHAEQHIPLAKKVPGLRKYEISRGVVGTPAGASDVHLVATLHFDDLAAVGAAFASPQGQAAAADVGIFATGGVEMYVFETQDA
jgi:uncharacterized protein (TIGR02118 family)